MRSRAVLLTGGPAGLRSGGVVARVHDTREHRGVRGPPLLITDPGALLGKFGLHRPPGSCFHVTGNQRNHESISIALRPVPASRLSSKSYFAATFGPSTGLLADTSSNHGCLR